MMPIDSLDNLNPRLRDLVLAISGAYASGRALRCDHLKAEGVDTGAVAVANKPGLVLCEDCADDFGDMATDRCTACRSADSTGVASIRVDDLLVVAAVCGDCGATR